MKLQVMFPALLSMSAPALALSDDIHQIEARIEELGVRVLWSKGNKACKEEGLLGKYIKTERTIYMCQENLHYSNSPILPTLQHEAWHVVQDFCNKGNAALSDEKIRSLISAKDRRIIQNHYPQSQWRSEAEARAVEFVPAKSFLNAIEHYCQKLEKKTHKSDKLKIKVR